MDMTFHNNRVTDEYARWLTMIGPADPYFSKFSIGLHEVLQAHFLLVDFFSMSERESAALVLKI